MSKETSLPQGDEFGGKFFKDLDDLERRILALKSAGRRIIFTNGAFDLLHVGHLRSLRGARALGDHLIVALNSDSSIRSSKGPGRPIFPAEERAEILAALECVDSIIIFNEPTADRVLDRLRPHVHAKGPDYYPGPPEAETVKAYGGELAFVGDPKGHASSDIITRILKAAGAERGYQTGRRE